MIPKKHDSSPSLSMATNPFSPNPPTPQNSTLAEKRREAKEAYKEGGVYLWYWVIVGNGFRSGEAIHKWDFMGDH